MERLDIGFIGAGKAAYGLGISLNQCGYAVTGVSSRSFSSAVNLANRIKGCKAYKTANEVARRCGLVFITTPDGKIVEVTEKTKWNPGQMVVHMSGAHSADVLDSVVKTGGLAGAFHPLRAFPGAANRHRLLEGVTVAVEAASPLKETLTRLATEMGARTVEIKPKDRMLYHASAVIASNYMVTLASVASRLWQHFGHTRTSAMEALLPLMSSTLENLKNPGLPDCLTGPVSRGDLQTVTGHIQALEQVNPEAARIYRILGLATVDIALEKKSIDIVQANELKSAIIKQEESHAENNA